MTKQELNRDIKRLWKSYEDFINTDPYNREKKAEIISEYERLYYADEDFDYMNKRSVLIMVALNRALRVIEFHQFGRSIEINL